MQKILKTLLISLCLTGAIASAALAASPPPAQPASTQAYVAGVNDLPLYKGLKLITADTVTYDSTSGRIIDVRYRGENIPVPQVQKFYDDILPQLGWEKQGVTSVYKRDKEHLTLTVKQEGTYATLHVMIEPAS